MSMYCTLSHRKIRGWGHLTKVEQHNARTIDTPSRDDDAPMPIEQLAGDGDMVDRTRALLTSKGVPHKLRVNTVLAYEDVYGASPGYWEARYPDGWKNAPIEELERDPLAVVLMEHAKRKYGEKLVSVRLHVDEKNPHWHVVSIPLVTGLHKQRGRKRKDGVIPPPVEKTTLYASHETERGGSGRRLEIEHDEWAKATEHLGLIRGARGSDLTDEERRDRRLRDTQSSRGGEERARVQREERKRIVAAEALVVSAADELGRTIGRGHAEATTIVANARTEASVIMTDAQAKADQVRRDAQANAQAATIAATRKVRSNAAAQIVRNRKVARNRIKDREEKSIADAADHLLRAQSAATTITAEAETEAARIERDAQDEADRLTQAIKDRDEKSIAEARTVKRDRGRLDIDTLLAETELTRKTTLLGDLVTQLEPLLEMFRGLPERVRRVLDRDGTMDRAAKSAEPLLDHASDAAQPLAKGPRPVEEIDPALLAAYAAREGGRGPGAA